MYSLYHVGSQQTSSMFFPRTPPRDIDFSDVPLKTLLVLVLRSIFHPSHVQLLGGFIGLPTSSLHPATACEQSVCGRPPGQPQRCSALTHEEQMTGPRAADFIVFPVHPSRCSPLHCPFRCTQYTHERLLLILSMFWFLVFVFVFVSVLVLLEVWV